MTEPDDPTGGVEGDPSEESPLLHSHLAYFVVPLPEPLGLPDKHHIVCAAPTPAEWYRQCEQDGLPFPPPTHMVASLVFRRAEVPSATGSMTATLFELARKNLPGPASEPIAPPTADGGMPSLPAPCTVVEMAVAFIPDDSGSGGASDAFDVGLACVRDIQRTYYLMRRRPIRLVTREALPFAIPYGIRQVVDEEGNAAPFTVPLSLFLLNMNLGRETRDSDLTPDELSRLTYALRQQSHPGFVTDYLELVREAEVALMADGSYRAAVLFAATSCEVLLDNLLLHLMWEEGLRPEEAAALFAPAESSVTARVKRHYHPRLGGQWSVDRPGPLRDWFTDVAGVRNRVVHGGYEPTLDEARAAAAGSVALSTHLADVVAKRAAKYPRTALALSGEVGLRRRNQWSRKIKAIQQDPSEVDWIATYARRHTAVYRLSDEGSVRTAPSDSSPWVCAVIRPGGQLQWVLHDRTVGMAAVVSQANAQHLTQSQSEELSRLRERLLQAGNTEAVSVSFSGISAPEPGPEGWVLEYRLVPMLGVMVHGKDLDPL